jgi:predicted DNA-binding transcriptional regulator AlpA
MHTSEDYWLTRPETAMRLKLPPKTLAQWSSQGKGPKFSKIGRFARYRLSDVIAWENAQLTRGEGSGA